jgi:hypothetical protein
MESGWDGILATFLLPKGTALLTGGPTTPIHICQAIKKNTLRTLFKKSLKVLCLKAK